MKTLRQILAENPEWADLPVGIMDVVGNVDFVGDSGMVFMSEHNDDPNASVDAKDSYKILVFSGN